MPDKLRTLVITGTEPGFEIDLSAFRGVREETGMRFSRLKNPTFEQLENHVRRLHIALGGKLPNIHLSAHMGPEGVMLLDGLVSPEKLSEILTGAPIIFLAGCESIDIADLLTASPYVLSMLEEIEHRDALAFSQMFWLSIGHGYEPSEAFDFASEQLPNIAEFAYLHANRFLAPKPRTE